MAEMETAEVLACIILVGQHELRRDLVQEISLDERMILNKGCDDANPCH
jgi:hypothetical protein